MKGFDSKRRGDKSINLVRSELGLGPLDSDIGDATIPEYLDANFRHPGESDDELRNRILVNSMKAADALDAATARAKEATEEAATEYARANPATHDELVEAEHEADELLGELTDFGCEEPVPITPASQSVGSVGKQWAGGTLTVQDCRGVDIISIPDIQFDTSVVAPDLGNRCNFCGTNAPYGIMKTKWGHPVYWCDGPECKTKAALALGIPEDQLGQPLVNLDVCR